MIRSAVEALFEQHMDIIKSQLQEQIDALQNGMCFAFDCVIPLTELWHRIQNGGISSAR